MNPRYLIFCLALISFLAGCLPERATDSKKEDTNASQSDVTAEVMTQKVGQAAESVKAFSQEKMKAFLQSAQDRLQKNKGEISQLEEKMKGLSEKTQKQSQKVMENLHAKFQDAQSQLEKLQGAGGAAWETSKDNLQNAMDHLQEASKEAASTFEKHFSEESETPKPATENPKAQPPQKEK